MFDCGGDTKCFYLAGKPVDLMLSQFGTKKNSEVYLVVARYVQCGTQAALGDRAVSDDPQGVSGTRKNNPLVCGEFLLCGFELLGKVFVPLQLVMGLEAGDRSLEWVDGFSTVW